jgi:hypothetical protein
MANSRLFRTLPPPILWRCVAQECSPFQGHTLVHGGSSNWDPNGRPQTAELQAFLGFPAQLADCPTAVISGAAPVNVTLTLDENESKVKYFFGVSSAHLEGLPPEDIIGRRLSQPFPGNILCNLQGAALFTGIFVICSL